MLIGELANRSGFSRDTIRYYEKLALVSVKTNSRADNGYKNYSVEVLERLHHIQLLKECGFTLLEIRQILTHDPGSHPCAELPEQLAEKIMRIDEKLAVLLEHKQALLQIQQSCTGACGTRLGLPDCIPFPAEGQKARSCC